MKQILLLLLLLPAAAFSQSIQSDQTEDFGNYRRIATSRVEFNGFSASLGGTLTIKKKDTVLYMNLFFRAGKPTFTDERTKAVLKLEDGETILVTNQGSYKELTATEPGFIVFALTAADKARLQQNKVVGYTIQTGNAKVLVTLNDRQKTAFYKTIDLLESRARSMASLD
jgi:hypothetical protein